jgi:hypothetical protein
MTKYQEMIQAAEEGRENWIKRRDSSTNLIFNLLTRFRKACEIPEEHLKILSCNENAERFGSEELPLTAATIETTERQWSMESSRPGKEYLISLLNENRASWAIIRQWTGLDPAMMPLG